jgi:hypothetical protein
MARQHQPEHRLPIGRIDFEAAAVRARNGMRDEQPEAEAVTAGPMMLA